jgi:hypothetical protein
MDRARLRMNGDAVPKCDPKEENQRTIYIEGYRLRAL